MRKKTVKLDNGETYKLVEGPRLQQILVHREAMIPITRKIKVVTKNPMLDFSSISMHTTRKVQFLQ